MRLHYFGDVNIRHGGYFFELSGMPHSARVLRVVPASDMDGPDNLFVLEAGDVWMDRPKIDIERALACAGHDDIDEWRRLTRAEQRNAKVDALLSYYGMERETAHWLQIGPGHEPGERQIDFQLRGNASLRRWVKAHFHEF